MARLNRKGELWQQLEQVAIFRDATSSPGSSTVTGAIPGIDTANPVLNVVSGTNFIANDWFRIRAPDNSVEVNRVSSISVNAITCIYPVRVLPVVGDPVVELTLTDLGHIESGGVTLEISGDENEVDAANRRLALGYLTGGVTLRMGFSLLGFNLENLATLVGQLESRVGGSGTQAVPSRLLQDGTQHREQNDLNWYFKGTRKDGTTCEVFALGVETDWTAMRTQLARGRQAPLPVSLFPTSGLRLATYL